MATEERKVEATVTDAGDTTNLQCSDILSRISAVLSPELFGVLERHDSYGEEKVCHCRNSKCLKLYCDCFSAGVLCDASRCECLGCANNAAHEAERTEVVRLILQKKRGAFRPKIDKADTIGAVGEHSKGCKCRKSACLKKYCECFQAGVLCNEKCRCIGCQNFKGSAERKLALSRSIERNIVPRVDSVGASAQKRNKRKRINAKASARLGSDTETCVTKIKRINIEQYLPFALTTAVRDRDSGKEAKPSAFEAEVKPAPLAGVIQQEDIERTSVRMLQDLYNLENLYVLDEKDSTSPSGQSRREQTNDSEIEMLVCKDDLSENDGSVGSAESSALAELQERSVLLRVKEFLQLLSCESYER